MTQPYIGEIRIFAGNFAPAGWAFCNGQLLSISENDFLFQLIGTTYGGDGQSNFALPDLRGRLPMHMGQGNSLTARTLSEQGGEEEVTLTINQLPSHNHLVQATKNPGTTNTPVGNLPAVAQGDIYTTSFNAVAMNAGALTAAGDSQPHSNMQPYLCVHFIISLFGIFPSAT